jgi:crossover junction endodeoxyribonuclease RusA
VIELKIPRDWLMTSNQRLVWQQRSMRTKAIREASFLATRTVRLDNALPMLEGRQHCTVLVSWPSRRRHDVHNVMPTVKAAIDGIVLAHLLSDDSDQYLIGPDLRVSPELCDKRWACVLVFSFEAAA